MRWSLIVKRAAPRVGKYRDWKHQLAEEGGHRCVYCCILEGRFGGHRNFHVEHFRPKSLFRRLENTYANLFYACAVCNSFKGDDWIEESPLSRAKPCYLDPSVEDYAGLFEVAQGRVVGTCVAGEFLVERLFLNRPQLVVERRISAVGARIPVEVRLVEEILARVLREGASLAARKKAITLLNRVAKLSTLVAAYTDVVPYGASDLQRSNAA